MIHHVQLACPAGSEDVLRGFYGGVLGFEEVAKPPVLAARGGCWFRGHGIELHLGVEQDFHPARKAHPGLLVQGLDGWAERLRAAGVPVRYDDDFPGMRRFYSEDPHGNRLEFLEPVTAPPDTTPADTAPADTAPADAAPANGVPVTAVCADVLAGDSGPAPRADVVLVADAFG